MNAVTGGHRGDRPPSLALGLFSGIGCAGILQQTGGAPWNNILHNVPDACHFSCGPAIRSTILTMGTIGSLEAVIEWMIPRYTGDAPYLNDALELARAVRAAQSTSTSTRLTPWQKYCLVPPKELLRLRSPARGQTKKGHALDAATHAAPLRAEPAERDRSGACSRSGTSPLALCRVRTMLTNAPGWPRGKYNPLHTPKERGRRKRPTARRPPAGAAPAAAARPAGPSS